MTTTPNLKHLHQLMLKAQRKNKGFDLTFDEIVSAWGYKSKSAGSAYLPLLVKAGLAIKKESGTKTIYRAIEKETNGSANKNRKEVSER